MPSRYDFVNGDNDGEEQKPSPSEYGYNASAESETLPNNLRIQENIASDEEEVKERVLSNLLPGYKKTRSRQRRTAQPSEVRQPDYRDMTGPATITFANGQSYDMQIEGFTTQTDHEMFLTRIGIIGYISQRSLRDRPT